MIMLSLMPYECTLLINLLWGTLSNAFSKSVYILSTWPSCSKHSVHVSVQGSTPKGTHQMSAGIPQQYRKMSISDIKAVVSLVSNLVSRLFSEWFVFRSTAFGMPYNNKCTVAELDSIGSFTAASRGLCCYCTAFVLLASQSQFSYTISDILDVEMTQYAEMTFKCHSRSSNAVSIESS